MCLQCSVEDFLHFTAQHSIGLFVKQLLTEERSDL